jgi:acyl-CoA thioester hydrolase
MNNFPIELKLRIDWSELDLFGHVNNVMFFKYIQASRVNYWESCNLLKHYTDEQIGPMLLSCNCQFKKPLFFPGNILVKTRMEFIKNTSFGLHHQILNETNELVAEANDVMVMYDYKKCGKVSFPASVRATVEKLENKVF